MLSLSIGDGYYALSLNMGEGYYALISKKVKKQKGKKNDKKLV